MKKLIVVALAILAMAINVNAACTIGANITPDPSGAALDQELWLNPDGVINNGDEVLGVTLGPSDVTGGFTSTTDCTAMPSMTVFVKSHFPGGVELISNEVAPTDIVPAVLDLAIKHQQ